MKYSLSLISGVVLLAMAGGCSDNDDPRPAPDLSAGARYSGSALELYYNGEQMPGKSAQVTVGKDGSEATIVFSSEFDLSQLTGLGLTGSVPGPGVTPGDAVLTLKAPVREGDGVYDVAGSAETEHVGFSYSGSIGKDKMVFNITDAKLKNQLLAGNVFAPAPIVKDGLAQYSSLPFHLVWEIDPAVGKDIPLSEILTVMATAPVIPVYQGTAYTSVAQGFESLVKTIALTGSGNVPVMYVSTLGGAAHMATTCGNMIQYIPDNAGIKLYLNPLSVVSEVLLAASDNKDDAKFDFEQMFKAPSGGDSASGALPSPDPALTRAMLGVLLRAIAPQVSGGVQLALSPTEQGADIYFDTQTSVMFLSTLLQDAMQSPEIMAAIKQALGQVQLPNVKPEEIDSILQQLPQFLIRTTKLEIGLSLVRVPQAQ